MMAYTPYFQVESQPRDIYSPSIGPLQREMSLTLHEAHGKGNLLRTDPPAASNKQRLADTTPYWHG